MSENARRVEIIITDGYSEDNPRLHGLHLLLKRFLEERGAIVKSVHTSSACGQCWGQGTRVVDTHGCLVLETAPCEACNGTGRPPLPPAWPEAAS